METTKKIKNGEEGDLLSALASHKEFGLSEDEMRKLLNPSLYIGRCVEQVEALLQKIKPLLEDVTAESEEISI